MQGVYYGRGRRVNTTTTKKSKSAEAWHQLRGAVEREHIALAKAAPRSPRIRPSLAPIQWVQR